jgi:hypothetical protein
LSPEPKGAEPNRRPGEKVRLIAKFDPKLVGQNVVIVSQSALVKMAAGPGDLLYASNKHWWYGGLRSVHVKAGEPGKSEDTDIMRISPEDADTAYFTEGQQVVLEKII